MRKVASGLIVCTLGSMAEALTDKVSYLPGERLRVTFSLQPGELPEYPVENISVDVLRVEEARNQFLIGFGTQPERSGDSLSVEVDLPTNAAPGLHVVAVAIITPPEGLDAQQTPLRFEQPFFEIRSVAEVECTPEGLREKIAAASRLRAAVSNRPHRTEWAKQEGVGVSRRFRVLIFAVGSVLHSVQQLEGFKVVPLKGSMSHRPLLDIANSYLTSAKLPPLPFKKEVELRFEGGSPSIVLDYHDVWARDFEDAFVYCRQHSDLVFLAIGLNRGHVPREFGGVAFDRTTGECQYYFHAPWHRSNLVLDFSPSAVGNAIETTLPRLISNPFMMLISRSFAEARSEERVDFQVLRMWTILELAADRHVAKDNAPLTHPNGSPITKPNGKPETNQSQVGRVYSYLRTVGPMSSVSSWTDETGTHVLIQGGDTSHPQYQPGASVYSLWEMVKSGYAIRNYVAHEGRFDPTIAKQGDHYQQLAAAAFEIGRPGIIQFVESAAQQVLWKEA